MGIYPGGGTQYMTSLIGRPRALELILGGELADAGLAERYGLVNRALPDESSLVSRLSFSEVAALARKLLAAGVQTRAGEPRLEEIDVGDQADALVVVPG